jgi:phosphatidylglycerol:prolipoprotein diacylglycerol transferase
MYPELRFLVAHHHVLVSSHAAAVVVAVLAGALLAVRRAREPAHALLATPLLAVTTLAGAHLGYLALRGGDAALPGGLVSMGGIAGLACGIGLCAWLLRARAVELLDVFAPAALLALGIGRLGCFLAGCCHGAPTTLPWGIVVPAAGSLPRHPLQLYAAAVDLVLVCWLVRAPRSPGSVSRRACVGFGVARFVLEWLRDPATTTLLPGAVLTLSQAGCLVLVVTGLVTGTGIIRLPAPALPQTLRRHGGALRR